MSDTILTAVIGGIAGLITGTIGSLIAPWVHWGIEKRRSQAERRRALIDNAEPCFLVHRDREKILEN
jgi:hypothetical protein